MHFCLGQELAPAVLGLLSKKNDSIYSNHRSHGYYIAKGGSIKKLIAEFYGKKTGTNGGLAGSQGLFSTDINLYSGAILSGAFSLSIGDAYSKIYKKQNSISIAMTGDGGMEEGIVNFASKMKLPILFICENNLYSGHIHLRDRVSNHKTHHKVKPFGIKTTYFKSNDPEKLYHKIYKIINEIKKNKKPQFLEIQTYRFNGHVGPENDDVYNYRPKKEMKFWKKRDPLNYYEKKLSKKFKNFKKIELKMQNKINKLIKEAFIFAEKSKFPKEFIKKNYINSYKNIKKFYQNKIKFEAYQESNKPKPY